MTDLMKPDNQKFNFEIKSLKEAMEYSKLISESDLAPKDYRGKPGNVLIAMQFGAEIGLLPLQAIQNIAVINGRPAIWGDAMIALVQNHPLCEYINEEVVNGKAYCRVKRRGEEEHEATFSMDDAKKAGLLGKPGPWTNYPDRMLQMRARGFALRDKFSDVLKGLALREEVEDYQVVSLSAVEKKSVGESKIKALILEKEKVIPLVTSMRIQEMLAKFALLGITSDHLKDKLGHPIEEVTEDEIVELQKYYKELKKEQKDPKEDDKK